MPCEELRMLEPAVVAEAELIQVRLIITTTSIVGSQKKCFEVANHNMNPLEISGFISCGIDKNILQAGIAFEAVTFNRRTSLHTFIDHGLHRRSRNVWNHLDTKEKWAVVLYF